MSDSVPTPSETDDLLNSPAQSAGILAEIQSLVACLMILASVGGVLYVVHTMHWPSHLERSVFITRQDGEAEDWRTAADVSGLEGSRPAENNSRSSEPEMLADGIE